MKNRRNYYRVLHVDRDAPGAIIKASYRALMQRLQMHPDLGGDQEQAAVINEAYATLSDADRRSAYDDSLKDAAEQRRERDPVRKSQNEAAAPRLTKAAMPRTVPCSFCDTPFSAARAQSRDSVCATCGSVLFPALEHQPRTARRAIERLPRSMPVSFRLSESPDVIRRGALADLSLSGMRLISEVRIPVGERVTLDCAFCSAVAVVRNERPEGPRAGGEWQCGVEFLTLRINAESGSLISTLA